MRTPFSLVVCLLVLVIAAGCGGQAGASAPTVAKRYEAAIFSRDGSRLCSALAPKLRQVIEERISNEQSESGATDQPRFDCASYYHLAIGYPHENMDRQFEHGTLLGMGPSEQAARSGVTYVKVAARVRVDFVYTGYSIYGGKSGEHGSRTLEDTVWLARGKDGRWGVVKPSLALQAALNADVLAEPHSISKANAAPPDPDYSMTRAERTAWEAADYRASFRRTILHAPLLCSGNSATVTDPLRDALSYPGPGQDPVGAPQANDVARVTVVASRWRACVTVTFRDKLAGPVSLGFTPTSEHRGFGTFVVAIDPSLGARGGIASVYRYFTGGDKLLPNTVQSISQYGRSVAFVANLKAAPGTSTEPPLDLLWEVKAVVSRGVDQVPDAAPGTYAVVRQSDGHVVDPRSG